MSDRMPYASSWLSGTVRHRRHAPVGHGFQYDTGMLALNLDEWTRFAEVSPLVSTGRFNWLSLQRRDYLDPDQPDLRQAVSDRVYNATGWRPDGPVELITHPRYFGYVFNPVSFYFCYRAGDVPADGAVPAVILAQITNTPWHQRHVYCLEVADVTTTGHGWQTVKAGFAKRFHVSPFNPMDQDYQWTFSFRGPELRIHMNVNRPPVDGDEATRRRIFDATLVVQRTPVTRKCIHKSLRQFPLESFKVIAGIYWHALRLKLKGVTFHTHPDKLPHDHPQRGLGREDRGKVPYCHGAPDDSSNRSVSTRVSSWRT